jgi:hypothetical protein
MFHYSLPAVVVGNTTKTRNCSMPTRWLPTTVKLPGVLLVEPTVLEEMDAETAELPEVVVLTPMEEAVFMELADYPSSTEVTVEIILLKPLVLVALVAVVEPTETPVVAAAAAATPAVLEVTTPETMEVVEVVVPTIQEPTQLTLAGLIPDMVMW